MPFGTFTLVIDGHEQNGTIDTKARLYLKAQGPTGIILTDTEFRFPTKYAKPGGAAISVPGFELTLDTDSTSGDSTTIGYEGYVTSAHAGPQPFQFAAPAAGTTLNLREATSAGITSISDFETFRDEAEAAAAAAQSAAGLAEQFAGPAWPIIEAGRLSDDVLSARFQQTRIYIPANHFMSAQGAPTLNVRGGLWPVWLLDQTTDEAVSVGFMVPKSWATFDVVIRGVNVAAGTGAVVFRVLHSIRGDGDDVTAGYTTGANAPLTAAALNIRQSVTGRTSLPADSTKTNVLRIGRVGSDAADTLANDYGFTGVELVATSYVSFVPEPVEATPTATGNFFTKASNDDLAGLRVFEQAPPPASDAIDETYAYWPATDVATGQNFNTSTWTGGNRWSFLWSNRCNYGDAWNKKPNPFPAPTILVGTRQARATFTTVARANAATQCQIRYMLGNDAATYQAPWIAAGGSSGDFVTDAALRAAPATYCTTDFTSGGTIYKVMTDKVYLPAPRLVDGTHPELQLGVVLDYEVQDTRTPSTTTAFINAVATDLHAGGKQLYLYTNPLNGSSSPYNGIDATNAPTLLGYADLMSVLLWSGNTEGNIATSYANQIATLGTLDAAAWAKVAITFELGNPGTSLADAQWVHDKLREAGTTHPTKVMFWRNLATQGGAGTTLTNQKIAAIIAP